MIRTWTATQAIKMAVEIRPATREEMHDFGLIGAYVFAGEFGDGPVNRTSTAIEPEWTLCAFVDGQMASMFATIPFTMRAVGNAMAVGGVSAVGTLPEFRRQGHLRAVMTEALRQMRDRGQSVACLWPSQSAIYQRYGYSNISVQRSYSIDTVDIAFTDGNFGSSTVARESEADCFDTIRKLYAEFVKDRMCYFHRGQQTWRMGMLEESAEDGPVHIAISRGDSGAPNGYVIYTLRGGRVQHRARNQEIRIRELLWTAPDAYRSLWRFLKSHDLVGAVKWGNAPSDDPALELFMEPRLLHSDEGGGVLFRMVDVPAALQARGYVNEGAVTIKVTDDNLAPWNEGTWAITALDGAAEVSESTGRPDITISVKALASLFTGYRTARDLLNWGSIEGSPEDIRRAGHLFETPYAPHCPDHF